MSSPLGVYRSPPNPPPSPSRLPVILPAAGASRRMGRPKLILPWKGSTVLARVVEEFARGGAGPIVVVTPPRTSDGFETMIQSVEVLNLSVYVHWVVPNQPIPDMKASILAGLDALSALTSHTPPAFLLAPADSVGLQADLVRRMIHAYEPLRPRRLVAPTRRSDGRKGHPALIPWELVPAIRALPAEVGVNALFNDAELRRCLDVADVAVEPVWIEEDEFPRDLDTPEDYQRLLDHDTGVESR